jgi:hypothetical protein
VFGFSKEQKNGKRERGTAARRSQFLFTISVLEFLLRLSVIHAFSGVFPAPKVRVDAFSKLFPAWKSEVVLKKGVIPL